MGPTAWIVNPSRRRKRRKSKSHRRGRSAAQRAATARMLAANRSRRRGSRRSRRVYASNPRRTSSRRRNRGFARMPNFRAAGTNAVSLLKSAGVAGAGAVAVDIGMGYLGRIFPTVALPVNTDGTTNWLYFAAKTGFAVGLGTMGRKLPGVGPYAAKMGEGALVVLAYQILRGFVPTGIALGAYFNPAPTMRPALAGSAAGGSSLGRIAGSGRGGQSLAAYESAGEASAARAANIVALSRR